MTGAGALYGVVFDAVQRHGWAVGGSGGHPVVFRTVDGGDHWLTGRVPDGIAGTLMDVEFPDDTHGWAVGPLTGNGPANASGGVVLATTDGGATWVTQAVPAGIGRLSRASFVEPIRDRFDFVGAPTSQGVRTSLRSLRSLGVLPPWIPRSHVSSGSWPSASSALRLHAASIAFRNAARTPACSR